MPLRTRMAPLLLALPVLLAGSGPPHGQTPAPTYDVYHKGIHLAELTVSGQAAARTLTLRRKDIAANRWLAPQSRRESEVGRDTSFQLAGSLRRLPERLASLERIRWSTLAAVGWPDTATIYVPAGTETAVVSGRRITATRWTHRDGSRPLDLVIGTDDRLIAGVDPSGDNVFVRRGYEGFTVVARWQDRAVAPARYGYRQAAREMVPMPDGVRLATLVYLPEGAGPGPFPTIFIRTPYGITGMIGTYWHYAARGYALVFQAVRGTSYWDAENRSEGVWEPMINEPADGAEALAWITRQPWSNGDICMQGGSYVGYTQWTITMARNPALKCIVPESSMGTAFSDQPFWGGTIVQGIAYYVFFMLDKAILPGRSWNEIMHHRPLVDLDRYATGQEIPQWDTLLAHTTNDAYWRRQDWYRSTEPRTFSSLQISGWFDDDFPGTESNWALMQRYGQGPQRLVIGPWKHGYNVDRRLNGYSFGPTAIRDDVWLLKQRWYDRFLRGTSNGVEREVVDYFVLGANTWRTATAWPPAEAAMRPWYLSSDGHATRLTTRGRLVASPPAGAEPPDRYVYDPATPPPNWYSFDQMQRWEDVQTFPYDMKDIEARPDVAVYTSEPLDRDLTIAGNLRLVLYASTDVRDTDWWVHVADVDTTGRSNRLTMGVLRARFRDLEDPEYRIFGSNFERERLLSGNPDEIVKYEISLRSIANTFRQGHRIRVAVMNAMDNYSFPNSNTGEDETRVTRTVPGRMGIHKSAAHPSHILLPVMPD